jgi:hypothetical protein
MKMHSQTVGRLRNASDAFSEEQRAAGELGAIRNDFYHEAAGVEEVKFQPAR